MATGTIDFTPIEESTSTPNGIDFQPINDSSANIVQPSIDSSTNLPMEGSRDTNGIYQGPPLIARIASANREFLRSLGTSKDSGDAYMQGLDNPSKSETFQKQLLRTGLIPDKNGTTSTLNSFAGGVAGQMADMVTNPISAILTSTGDLPVSDIAKAIKSVATTSASPAIQQAQQIGAAIKSAFPNLVDFGGDKALTRIAQDSKDSIDAANSAFKQSYDNLFQNVGDKVIPQDSRDRLLNTAVTALDQTAPGTAANNYLSNKFPEILDDKNLDVQSLHSLKGQIFKQAKSSIGPDRNALMQVYGDINKELSSKGLGGQDYADLTTQQHDFITNESNYIKKLVLDPVNKNNVTNQKLKQFNLSENYKDALQKLSARPTSTSDLLNSYEAVRRGTILKNAIISYGKKALIGAGIAGLEYAGLRGTGVIKGKSTN